MNCSITNGRREGIIKVPPSKSDAQRALLAAALSNGTSELSNIGESDDVNAMLDNIKQLDAKIVGIQSNKIRIKGIASFPETVEFNVRESGLGLRLLIGVCAPNGGVYKFNGTGSILNREQNFYDDYFPLWGANVKTDNGFLPIELSGKIGVKIMEIDGSHSSQYLSGLIMGLSFSDSDTEIYVNDLVSTGYVQMTIDTLAAFGVRIENEKNSRFKISGNQAFQATNYTVEGDWSAASCWLVASAIGHDIEIQGLNIESSQADRSILDAFKRANCEVINTHDGIKINGVGCAPFSFDATNCPDLFPALVTLAAYCPGVTTLIGVKRLRNKESDRGIVLQKEFGKLGLKIEIEGDEMKIYGGPLHRSEHLDSNNDHRIAMCLAIAATNIEGGCDLSNADAVSKSYPEFWSDLNSLVIH